MAMTRDEVVETLEALAAPLTPWTSFQERLEYQDRWVDAGGVELFEALVDLIASPPPEARLLHASLDDWNILLDEIAGTLGKRYPDVAMRRLLPLLDDERARPAVIGTLGRVGDVRAIPDLERLVQDRRLGTAELVDLAGTLGAIGGDAACRLLEQLREAAAPGHGELLQEIDVALQVAGRKP